jgi:replicative superfamily II helicase
MSEIYETLGETAELLNLLLEKTIYKGNSEWESASTRVKQTLNQYKTQLATSKMQLSVKRRAYLDALANRKALKEKLKRAAQKSGAERKKAEKYNKIFYAKQRLARTMAKVRAMPRKPMPRKKFSGI